MASKWTSSKWEAFKSVLTRVQGKHIPLRVKGKAGRCRKPWMTQDIEALVKKKKEAHDMHRQLGSSKFLEEYRGCRRRVERKQEGKKGT